MLAPSRNFAWFASLISCAARETFDLHEIKLFLQDGHWDDAAQRLTSVRDYLRADDERLVRPAPSTDTAQRQVELEQAGLIDVVSHVLLQRWFTLGLSHSHVKVLTLVAELVHLLTTSNPFNRVRLGSSGVIRPLVAMIEAATAVDDETELADDVLRGGEEAAEALWILAYAGGDNSPDVTQNHEQFATAGAVRALSDHILDGRSARGRMWAAAALGNMAADYNNHVATETSEAVRLQILKHDGLLDALVKMLSQGPVRSDTATELWPSQARRSERFARSIEAWGAGQALKSVALTLEAQHALNMRGTVAKACKLQNSPDWLEKLKADLILVNMKADCESVKNSEL